MQVEDEIASTSTTNCIGIDCVRSLIMKTHWAAASVRFITTFVNNPFGHKCDVDPCIALHCSKWCMDFVCMRLSMLTSTDLTAAWLGFMPQCLQATAVASQLGIARWLLLDGSYYSIFNTVCPYIAWPSCIYSWSWSHLTCLPTMLFQMVKHIHDKITSFGEVTSVQLCRRAGSAGKSYPPENFITLKNQTKRYKICGNNLEMVGNDFHPINEEIKVEPEDFTPQTTVQDNISHGGRQLKPRKINTSRLKSKTVCQKINSYDHPNMSGNLRTSTLCKRSKSHLCKVCGKGYTTKGSLSQHINIHKGQRFNCKKCGMTFTYKSNLRSHWLRHLGLRLFKCETCGKNFNQNSNLTRHKMIHEEEILFKCRWCAKTIHLTIHSGETLVKSFKCEECGKAFLTKSNLNIHSISHNGLKLHSCELCGKFFKYKSYLKNHAYTHNSHKAFKCEECGMNFAQKCHLKKHSLRHSKQPLFVCEVCGKSFKQKRYLTMHKICRKRRKLKNHNVDLSGQKYFRCNKCGNSSLSKGNKTRHTQRDKKFKKSAPNYGHSTHVNTEYSFSFEFVKKQELSHELPCDPCSLVRYPRVQDATQALKLGERSELSYRVCSSTSHRHLNDAVRRRR
uniref:C2H2-type domain-containing protein n=1 Tax=Timema genevievae TaxID=629358 RepID=A0A7R9PJN1_TIMGE|nr:unnamed protein product [Timema genevievae]